MTVALWTLFVFLQPPVAVLQSVLTLFVAEKQYIKLASVVKLAACNGVLLDKTFCQKSLVELRRWGKDPDSISAAYKSLRKFDEGGRDKTMPGLCTSAPSNKVNHTLQRMINLRRSSSALSSPPPPPPPRALPRSASLNSGVSTGQSSSCASVSVSHDGVHQIMQRGSSDSKADMSSIFELIEVEINVCVVVVNMLTIFLFLYIQENGSKDQFGAVAAILTNLPDSHETYSNKVLYSVWKGMVSTDQRAVNCFRSLLASLDQYRTPRSHTANDHHKPGSSLLASDRWLISQVGIALLKGCDQHQDWQSGFLLLHNFHNYGIHYVKLSQPSSCLPPFMPRPPSPCEVALLAVKMCLKMEQVGGALEVLRGCNWIEASNDDELNKRTEMLCSLAEKCLEERMLQEAWKCLDNIDSRGKVLTGFINMVTNLHNKLLQNVLTLRETSFSLTIYRKMKNGKLQCLPTVFSALLQHLCDKKQVCTVQVCVCVCVCVCVFVGSCLATKVFIGKLPATGGVWVIIRHWRIMPA